MLLRAYLRRSWLFAHGVQRMAYIGSRYRLCTQPEHASMDSCVDRAFLPQETRGHRDRLLEPVAATAAAAKLSSMDPHV